MGVNGADVSVSYTHLEFIEQSLNTVIKFRVSYSFQNMSVTTSDDSLSFLSKQEFDM